jgi:hypothetical protein
MANFSDLLASAELTQIVEQKVTTALAKRPLRRVRIAIAGILVPFVAAFSYCEGPKLLKQLAEKEAKEAAKTALDDQMFKMPQIEAAQKRYDLWINGLSAYVHRANAEVKEVDDILSVLQARFTVVESLGNAFLGHKSSNELEHKALEGNVDGEVYYSELIAMDPVIPENAEVLVMLSGIVWSGQPGSKFGLLGTRINADRSGFQVKYCISKGAFDTGIRLGWMVIHHYDAARGK